MRMRNRARRCAALLLAASLLLSLAACSGGSTTAATMHLRRTEGTVAVSDGGGKDVPLLDNLGLYSGYEVGTRSASYAWIDLDDVKLAKLDQNSGIAIRKEGKALDIEVKSGSLFFNVAEPLADDETMSISTSTMLVGIRGTCGWVEDNGGLSRVYLLAGKVECSAGGRTVQVNAGEFAELTADGELVVKEFPEQGLPAFVRDEVYNPDTDPGFYTDTFPPVSSAPLEPSAAPDQNEDLEPGELPAARGKAGENVKWAFYKGEALLIIEGTGLMKDYDTAPWYEYRNDITKVIIRDGVTSIGNAAFCDCHFLAGVTIPSSVTRIGDEAFRGCTYNLTSVAIPASVNSIGTAAFLYCDGLEDVYYGGSAARWEQIDIGDNNDELLGANIIYGG